MCTIIEGIRQFESSVYETPDNIFRLTKSDANVLLQAFEDREKLIHDWTRTSENNLNKYNAMHKACIEQEKRAEEAKAQVAAQAKILAKKDDKIAHLENRALNAEMLLEDRNKTIEFFEAQDEELGQVKNQLDVALSFIKMLLNK